MYADPDDVIPTPQLPSRNYDKGEHHVNVPVQETGQVSVHGSSLASNAVHMFEAIRHQIYAMCISV